MTDGKLKSLKNPNIGTNPECIQGMCCDIKIRDDLGTERFARDMYGETLAPRFVIASPFHLRSKLHVHGYPPRYTSRRRDYQ